MHRKIPDVEHPGTLQRMISAGAVRPPAETGTPDVMEGLAPSVQSLSDVLIADRDKERRR